MVIGQPITENLDFGQSEIDLNTSIWNHVPGIWSRQHALLPIFPVQQKTYLIIINLFNLF